MFTFIRNVTSFRYSDTLVNEKQRSIHIALHYKSVIPNVASTNCSSSENQLTVKYSQASCAIYNTYFLLYQICKTAYLVRKLDSIFELFTPITAILTATYRINLPHTVKFMTR